MKSHFVDKKSILMYIMCLYNSIHRNNLDDDEHQLNYDEDALDETLDSVQSEMKSDSDGESETKKAKLHSKLDDVSLAKSIEDLTRLVNEPRKSFITDVNIVQTLEHHSGFNQNNDMKVNNNRPLSTASVEIGDYQSAIEDVLEKLLKAEETIALDPSDPTSLVDARKMFQAHEEFMLKLADYQVSVGSALEEGTKLVTDPSGLTNEEQNEIKHQLFLLNERWETLRVKALNTQTTVHKKLAKMQFEKVEELKEFLTATEDRLSLMTALGPDPDELRQQMEEHKNLQKDLESQQTLVVSLSNLVIIEDSEYFRDLEDKLAALEERWSHVVKWTAKRWENLQDLSFKWTKLAELHRIINMWIDTREKCLKDFESKQVEQIGDAMERIKCLQFCKIDLKSLLSNVEKLDTTAGDLDKQELSTLNIADKIEALNDRIEALNQILEVQQSRIDKMGFSINLNSTRRSSLPKGWEDFQQQIHELDSKSFSSMKVQTVEIVDEIEKKVENEQVTQLNENIMDMVYFIDEIETTITDLYQLDAKAQISILEKMQEKLKLQVQEYEKSKALLVNCKDEIGSLEIEDQHIQELGTKYDLIGYQIEELIEAAKNDMKKERFLKIKLLLADMRDWYKQHANETSKEDLEKKLEEMEGFVDEIKEVEIEGDDEWKRDFTQFNESWNDMKGAISRLVEEISPSDDAESIKEFDQQSEEILTDIEDMEKWLEELAKTTPETSNEEFDNINDLFQVKSKYQALKESCEQMTIKFRELNEKGSETLLQGDDTIQNKRDSKFSDLSKHLTKLISRWNEVTTRVYTRTAELEFLSTQYGELKTLLVSEAGYLDKLDKLLRKSPENAADAEEISEELDHIENYLRSNSSDSRIDKIQEIGKELSDSGFFKNEIADDITKMLIRRDMLQHQVNICIFETFSMLALCMRNLNVW